MSESEIDAPAGVVDGPSMSGVETPERATRRPRRLRALLLGLVLAAALALFLFVGLGTGSNGSSGAGGVVPVGSAAPGFVLPSVVGGAPVDLHALGVDRHHPVILNFFASWCGPCRTETPLIASTARAEQAKGSVLQFVGVDVGESPSASVPFIEKSGITYPVGDDAKVRVAGGTYGLNGQPNTFFIDEAGTVVGHVAGPVTRAELQQWVHRLAGGG